MASESVSVLRVSLSSRPVGYLAGYRGGRNVMVFDESFRGDPDRPTNRSISMVWRACLPECFHMTIRDDFAVGGNQRNVEVPGKGHDHAIGWILVKHSR